MNHNLENLFHQARKMASVRNLEHAIIIYRLIINHEPKSSIAWYELASALAATGKVEEAEQGFVRASQLTKSSAQAQNYIGIELLKINKNSSAEHIFRNALKLDPEFSQAHANLGIALSHRNKKTLAIKSLLKAYNLSKDEPSLLITISAGLLSSGDLTNAEIILNKVLLLNQNSAAAFELLGQVYNQLGKYKSAAVEFKKALELEPNSCAATSGLGLALLSMENFHNAEEIFRKSIQLNPTSSEDYTNLSVALLKQGRLDEAKSAAEESISLNKYSPIAFSNLGSILLRLNLNSDAEVALKKALTLDRDLAAALSTYGVVLSNQGNDHESKKKLRAAIKIEPQHKEAHINLSHLLFGCFRFAEGWPHYEYRFKTTKDVAVNSLPDIPTWDGNFTDQVKLVVHAEQGIGDEILYAAFLQKLNEHKFNQPITVTVDKRLISIYERSFPNLRFLDRKETLKPEEFNTQIPLASLGQFYLNGKDDFSKTQHPYLKFDASRASQLREKIARENRMLCGLSWSSKNKDIGQPKSLGLDQLAPILSLPNLQFVNLQYGDVREQIEAVEAKLGIKILQIEEIDNTNDIDGLLALIAACDFVVTTSNVTTHLAGSISKETYQLSPKGNGKFWYWKNQDDRGHSLWYPSVKILEQEEIGDWSAPIARLKSILENR